MEVEKNSNFLGEVGNKEDRPYINRFITFYTLRLLWKRHKNSVPELHRIMFAGGKVVEGRTTYNKMLKIDTYVKETTAKKCEEITGVDYRYFTGERGLAIADLSISTWWRFVELWNNRKDGDAEEFAELESAIHEKIRRAANTDLTKQQAPFRDLAYFAQNKGKKTVQATLGTLSEIEKLTQGFTKRELETVEAERLEAHRLVLREYLDRVTAISVLKKWK